MSEKAGRELDYRIHAEVFGKQVPPNAPPSSVPKYSTESKDAELILTAIENDALYKFYQTPGGLWELNIFGYETNSPTKKFSVVENSQPLAVCVAVLKLKQMGVILS